MPSGERGEAVWRESWPLGRQGGECWRCAYGISRAVAACRQGSLEHGMCVCLWDELRAVGRRLFTNRASLDRQIGTLRRLHYPRNNYLYTINRLVEASAFFQLNCRSANWRAHVEPIPIP